MGQKSVSEMQKLVRLGSTLGGPGAGVRADVCAGLPSDFWFFLRGQEQFQRNPDSYNGAVRENYTWSQDYTDLELKVPVPEHVVKGRQVTGLFALPALLSLARVSAHCLHPWPPPHLPHPPVEAVRPGVGHASHPTSLPVRCA